MIKTLIAINFFFILFPKNTVHDGYIKEAKYVSMFTQWLLALKALFYTIIEENVRSMIKTIIPIKMIEKYIYKF